MTFEHGLAAQDVAAFAEEYNERSCKDVVGDGYKLMFGDCLTRMKEIPDGSVDMILTDPPYAATDCDWDEVIDFSSMWRILNRKAKDKCKVVLTASNPFSSRLVCSNIDNFLYSWVWNKGNAGNFQQAKYRPLKVTEDILVFQSKNKGNDPLKQEFFSFIRQRRELLGLSLKQIGDFCGERWYFKGGFKYFETGVTEPTLVQYIALKEVLGIPDKFDNLFGDIKYHPQGIYELKAPKIISNTGKGGRLGHINSTGEYAQTISGYPKNLLNFKREGGLHPTQKPVALMEYLIRTYTNEGETVLDFTMGSGTTIVAALNTGRKAIGIEMDEGYFNIASKRIAEAQQIIAKEPNEAR